MHTAVAGALASGRQHAPRGGCVHGNGAHEAMFPLHTPWRDAQFACVSTWHTTAVVPADV